MDDRCTTHQFEAAEDFCRTCGGAFCNECLVYAFGPGQPPFCLNCALAAAGVRSNAARAPQVSKREMRARAKERRRKAKEEKKTAAAAAANVEIDWSVPTPEDGGGDGMEWMEELVPPTDERVIF